MPSDVTRRTQLANERTYLAWWRTGLTTLTVAIASARVVPELAKAPHRWPYTIIGATFALLGTFCLFYAERRRGAVERALAEDSYATPDPRVTRGLAAVGVILGLGLFALILADA